MSDNEKDKMVRGKKGESAKDNSSEPEKAKKSTDEQMDVNNEDYIFEGVFGMGIYFTTVVSSQQLEKSD